MTTRIIKELLGQAILDITGAEKNSVEIIFTTLSGNYVRMHHQQDCCESVYLEDIVGDINDLLYSEVLVAEECTQEPPEDAGYCESATWTFYKLGTNKGTVTLRWCGESNGYYSESVDVNVFTNLREA